MPRCTRLEKSAYLLLILLAVVFMGAVTRDAWRMIGRPWTGFPVMENMLVGVGGTQRTAAEPFDLVRAVNGRLVGYFDLAGTHRFTKLFFLAWTLWPALFAHLALVLPERTSVARRWPRVVWVPYVLSAALWLWLQAPVSRDSWAATAGAIAIYWTA